MGELLPGIQAQCVAKSFSLNNAEEAEADIAYDPMVSGYLNSKEAKSTTQAIRPGTSLRSIAQKEYGDSKLWVYISAANGNIPACTPKTVHSIKVPSAATIKEAKTRTLQGIADETTSAAVKFSTTTAEQIATEISKPTTGGQVITSAGEMFKPTDGEEALLLHINRGLRHSLGLDSQRQPKQPEMKDVKATGDKAAVTAGSFSAYENALVNGMLQMPRAIAVEAEKKPTLKSVIQGAIDRALEPPSSIIMDRLMREAFEKAAKKQ